MEEISENIANVKLKKGLIQSQDIETIKRVNNNVCLYTNNPIL